MPEVLRFAIVGTGAIARSYEQAFAGLPGASLVAACDLDRTAGASFAARVGCKYYSSYQHMAMESQIDATIVCTPPATHEEICVFFLERGLPVLCEKPLSTNVPSARRMLAAAERNGVVFTMASKFRYVDDVQTARAIARSGRIGDIVLIENAFTSRVDMSERWNCNASLSGGGVLIDNGTHSVDILRYFLGSLADVQVFEGRRIQGLQVEDTVRVFVRSCDGVIGSSDLSWSINKELDTFLHVYGSEGTILVGWNESRYRVAGDGGWHIFGKGYDKVSAFRAQIVNFCDAVLGRAELRITPRDALASVEVVSAAYAALERSRWEAVSSQLEVGSLEVRIAGDSGRVEVS
ncbi:MAG TPA: Gfo/Idh/MocA family oxidoreductase [Candidatus Baltobacteraceae bacterium]|jgi:predicted dehydrogenase